MGPVCDGNDTVLPAAGRLPRVASWRDVLEIGSSSSTRLRELGEG